MSSEQVTCKCGVSFASLRGWEQHAHLNGQVLAGVHVPLVCAECGHGLIPPAPAGQPGDDSYYCEGCGRAWSLDLRREAL